MRRTAMVVGLGIACAIFATPAAAQNRQDTRLPHAGGGPTSGPLGSTAPVERFTFVPANFPGAPPMNIVIKRWSSEADRDRVLAAVSGGPQELGAPIATSFEVGYIDWPGSVQYVLRYASRMTRPDGTEDIVLATDRPMWIWWDGASKPPAAADHAYTVIQLRLDKSGTGEGKLSFAEAVTADTTAKTIVLADYAARPAVLTNVRRATGHDAD